MTRKTKDTAKIRRALAQGVSDHGPWDSNNEQHPFFAGLIQKLTILKTRLNIEPQLLQLLLLLLLLLLKLLFLVQKTRARGGLSGSLRIFRYLFSAPIFGYRPFAHFFVFCAKLVPKQLPKWGPFLTRLTFPKCSK